MIELYKYKDDFKLNFPYFSEIKNISIGKTTNTTDKIVTFYSAQPSNNTGFKYADNTHIRNATILLRYGKNQRIAEEMAMKIQQFYENRVFQIEEYKNIYSVLEYSEPISLGTDDEGVYEYSFNLSFLENK